MLLSAKNLVSGYGQITVLKGISIEVEQGEIVTIIGANGAGKTTLLMCLSRVQPLRSGDIQFEQRSILDVESHQLAGLGLAQVPEGRKIFPRLSVLENLELGAFCRKAGDSIQPELDRVFSLFPVLFERKQQLGGTLSGGEQQMLAIGRALMSKPRMLLLDEPSMGVAPLLVQKIFETIKKLNQEGMTILLVEQNAQLALSLAQRGYVLETGEIILSEKSSVLLSDPRVQEAYLGG